MWKVVTSSNLNLWGQRTYDLAHFPLGSRARAEESSRRGHVVKVQTA